MNASVAFVADETPDASAAAPRPVVMVPAAAVHDGAVFVMLDDKAVQRAVKTGETSGANVRILEGLVGGEDLILDPPATLKDGAKVRRKG
jgi:hypothetical protein